MSDPRYTLREILEGFAAYLHSRSSRSSSPHQEIPTMASRDTTRALQLAQALRQEYDFEQTDEKFTELVQILTNEDARTGRRDPSSRKKATKKSAKKAAKKSATRTRR